jgi:hypothetical protein
MLAIGTYRGATEVQERTVCDVPATVISSTCMIQQLAIDMSRPTVDSKQGSPARQETRSGLPSGPPVQTELDRLIIRICPGGIKKTVEAGTLTNMEIKPGE